MAAKGVQWRLAIWLAVVWSLSLLYGETLQFWLAANRCDEWPIPGSNATGSKELDSRSSKPYRLAFISNPQLINDPWSSIWVNEKFDLDLFLRRSFRLAVLPAAPDAVFVMGRMVMDQGARGISRPDLADIQRRFRHIFDPSMPRRRRRGTPPKAAPHVYGLPGDEMLAGMREEDLGLFVSSFGILNSALPLGFFQLLTPNTLLLDAAPSSPAGHKSAAAAWAFMDRVAAGIEGSKLPNLVVSLRPLHLPIPSGQQQAKNSPSVQCSSATWQSTAAATSLFASNEGHPTELSVESTKRLLSMLDPVIGLVSPRAGPAAAAGICSFDRQLAAGGASRDAGQTESSNLPEILVGDINYLTAFSPSFMLIDVVKHSSTNETSVSTAADGIQISVKRCLLPNQQLLHVWYSLLTLFSVATILLLPTRGFDVPNFFDVVANFPEMARRVLSGPKLKVDEDVDFEEVFDAEGNVHLLPKMKPASSSPQEDSSTTSDRKDGRAQIRQSAKRLPEDDVRDVAIDVQGYSNQGMLVGENGFLQNTITLKLLLRRSLSAIGPLALLLGLELFLYVGLLAKDWA